MRSQKKTGLKKSISWIILMAILLVSPSLLSGCKGVELENKTEQVRGYSRQQAMILLANERNRYQNVYSPEIWQGRAPGRRSARPSSRSRATWKISKSRPAVR